jgi:hypothetical protein
LIEAKEKPRPKATPSPSVEAGSRVVPFRTEPESTG